MLNKVMIIGNLTRDVDLRYLSTGAAVGEFGIAINDSYKSKDGEKKDSTTYVNVSTWGNTAENCAKYIGKGSKVFIEGRLKFDEWEKDGKKYSKLSVTANNVQFLNKRGEDNATSDDDQNLPF